MSFLHRARSACLVLLTACGSPAPPPAAAALGCADYCSLAWVQCNQANLLYRSTAECLTACQRFPLSADANVTTGNSLQCRLNYLLMAQRSDRRVLCRNAAASGGFSCL